MIYTLKMCIGMFLGMCGSISNVDFPSKQECLEAREQVVNSQALGKGYAICIPKTHKEP